MPLCPLCRAEVRGVAAYCHECGAPLSELAARLRQVAERQAEDSQTIATELEAE